MSTTTMQYKDYTALIEYSDEEKCLIGEAIGIRHGILFRGSTNEDIFENFKMMIDFYLKDCAEDGIEPCKPPTGAITFPQDLLALAYQKAEHKGIPIQIFMENAVQQAIS